MFRKPYKHGPDQALYIKISDTDDFHGDGSENVTIEVETDRSLAWEMSGWKDFTLHHDQAVVLFKALKTYLKNEK